jgi:hypothetical protein
MVEARLLLHVDEQAAARTRTCALLGSGVRHLVMRSAYYRDRNDPIKFVCATRARPCFLCSPAGQSKGENLSDQITGLRPVGAQHRILSK